MANTRQTGLPAAPQAGDKRPRCCFCGTALGGTCGQWKAVASGCGLVREVDGELVMCAAEAHVLCLMFKTSEGPLRALLLKQLLELEIPKTALRTLQNAPDYGYDHLWKVPEAATETGKSHDHP